jgi:addiction module HigA family antidote
MPTHDQHPGIFLLERYLNPLGVTPSALATALGVGERQVHDLVEGRSPITPDTAGRLAFYFDVPARWWLELQARYDAEHLTRPEELRDEVTPYSGLVDVLVTPQGIKRLVRSEQPSRPVVATYSEEFLQRLEEQAKWAKEVHRTPVQMTLSDGTVVLTGE